LAIYAVMAFLFPVGIYCLVLASINRRTTPLMVSGFWDTVGLLAAASGFFLVTVPMILDIFYERAVGTQITRSFDEIWGIYGFLWFIYYLLLISGSAYLLSWRNHKTMIYNVDPEIFQELLEKLFAPLGLRAKTLNHRFVIGPAESAEMRDNTAVAEGLPAPLSAPAEIAARHAELEIESFHAMCHVTMHWEHYAADVRREVEEELQKHLPHATPQDNAAAGWFLSASGLVFGILTMLLGALLVLIFYGRS
jgi:hypothetical protein